MSAASFRHPNRGAAEPRRAEAPTAEAGDALRPASFAEEALATTRARNVLVTAWIHVALRAAITTVGTWAAVARPDPFYRTGAAIHGAFLLAAIAVLALHQRPWARPHATRALAALALAGLAVGGWRGTHSLPALDATQGVTLVIFGAHVLLLVTAFAGLAAEESLGAYCTRVLRAHRDELTAANLRIRSSQAHAERLAQLIVHDLKNPLTAILTHASLVQQALESMPGLEEEREDLRIVQEEGRRLSNMIGDLLLVGRLESGAMAFSPALVSVASVVEPVGRTLRAVASSRAAQLEVSVPPDLVAPLDTDLVRRLLENLVLNAVRYTGPGDRIEIAASSDGAALRLAVRNTGRGISEAARERLFEKDGTAGAGGEWRNVGLGLYLCRLVAAAHGGSIALVESPGWNVAFEVVVPVDPRCAISSSGAMDSGPLPATRFEMRGDRPFGLD